MPPDALVRHLLKHLDGHPLHLFYRKMAEKAMGELNQELA